MNLKKECKLVEEMLPEYLLRGADGECGDKACKRAEINLKNSHVSEVCTSAGGESKHLNFHFSQESPALKSVVRRCD